MGFLATGTGSLEVFLPFPTIWPIYLTCFLAIFWPMASPMQKHTLVAITRNMRLMTPRSAVIQKSGFICTGIRGDREPCHQICASYILGDVSMEDWGF